MKRASLVRLPGKWCLASFLVLALAPAASAQTLIGHWPFDGNGLDFSGGGRPVSLFGGVGFAAGLSGQALDLHANPSQYAERPINDAIYNFGTSDFTIQVWVNFNTTSGEQVLIEKFSGSGGPGWTLTKLGGNQFHFYASPTVVLTSGSIAITTGVWHRIVARRTGPRFEILYDGAVISSGIGLNPVPITSMPLLIGKRNQFDGRHFPVNGRIDEVAIWSCSIKDAELTGGGVPVPGPVANAGPDQSVPEGASVQLDGSASTVACGVPLFHWVQIAGPLVPLNLSDPARPTFTAPFVPMGGATLTFRLDVGSSSDTVDVTVRNINHAPDALAGDDQTVAELSPVALDGSDSFDPDDDPITWSWLQTAGPPVVLNLTDPARPTFTAPLVGPLGETLTFVLTVSDTELEDQDEVSVFVENVNHDPTADAGADQTRNEGAAVALDGSASQDPDGDALTWTWLQIGGPVVSLSDTGSAAPTFTAPQVGFGGNTLVFRLTVEDGLGGVDTDEVSIQVLDTNAAPVCDLARPSVGELWPPNHKMVAVSILGVTDPENDGITITVLGVTQDEPTGGLGDGDTSPDAVIQGGTVLLRAERSGNGNGRVYRVSYRASDGVNSCTGQVTVTVPHSKGRNAPSAVDDGQVYNSLLP